MNNPKVSVIIPNYNHAPYLSQRIESVLYQTFQDIEVILMDDCSLDSSRAIIAQYAAQDSRIRVVLNEQNSGSTFKQWNRGFALAQGQYIWVAESDDYAEPNLLEILVARLDSNLQVGLAYCQSFSVDERGLPFIANSSKQTSTWEGFYNDLDPELWKNDFTVSGIQLVRRFMTYRNIIPNASAVLLRHSLLKETGPADETFRVLGDWVFWAKIMAITSVTFVAQPLNYFRSHRNNVRTKTWRDGTGLVEFTRMLLAIKQYGEPVNEFYQKSIDLFGDWFESFIHQQVPKSRHLAIYRNMVALEPGFRFRFLRAMRSILFRNNFEGLRAVIKNKVLPSFSK